MSNLANAKSTYSSKTRIGNWSEDQFGKELASQPRPEVKHTTIAQEDFPRHPTSVYQNRTMPTGTRDSGATFADMFGHRGAASGKDHFQTSDPINGGQRRSGAARKRAKQLNAEKSTSPFASQKSVAESQFKKQAARTLRTTGKSVVASVDRTHARSGAFTKELSKGR